MVTRGYLVLVNCFKFIIYLRGLGIKSWYSGSFGSNYYSTKNAYTFALFLTFFEHLFAC